METSSFTINVSYSSDEETESPDTTHTAASEDCHFSSLSSGTAESSDMCQVPCMAMVPVYPNGTLADMVHVYPDGTSADMVPMYPRGIPADMVQDGSEYQVPSYLPAASQQYELYPQPTFLFPLYQHMPNLDLVSQPNPTYQDEMPYVTPSSSLGSVVLMPLVTWQPQLEQETGGVTPLMTADQPPYPIVHISPAGLLTVLLRDDVVVEMTGDKTIRVVNHRQQSVVATTSRGNASCIHHSLAKLYQEDTKSEAELSDGRCASMATECILIGQQGGTCYALTNNGQARSAPNTFRDLSRDLSISLLYSSPCYGPQYVALFDVIARDAKYSTSHNGASIVHINGVRICQATDGDVTVTSGRKRLRVSPQRGLMYVNTHFAELLVTGGDDWTVRMRRGEHRLLATPTNFRLSDGRYECGFDVTERVYVLPLHTVTQAIVIRETGEHLHHPQEQQQQQQQLQQQLANLFKVVTG